MLLKHWRSILLDGSHLYRFVDGEERFAVIVNQEKHVSQFVYAKALKKGVGRWFFLQVPEGDVERMLAEWRATGLLRVGPELACQLSENLRELGW